MLDFFRHQRCDVIVMTMLNLVSQTNEEFYIYANGVVARERFIEQSPQWFHQPVAINGAPSPIILVSDVQVHLLRSKFACKSFSQARHMWTTNASSCRSCEDRLYRSTASMASFFEAWSWCHQRGRGAISPA